MTDKKKAVSKSGKKWSRKRKVDARVARSKKQFLEAFDLSMGNVALACKKMNISRNTFYEWQNNDPKFAATVADHKEEQKDMVESKMYQAILADNTTMMIFYAKTQMKDRGYVERQELAHSGGDAFMDMMKDAARHFDEPDLDV